MSAAGVINGSVTSGSVGTIPQKMFNQPLCNPEVVKVVFDLLLCSPANRRWHSLQTLGDLNRMLTVEQNMLTLWEFPWIDWLTRFYQQQEQQPLDATSPAEYHQLLAATNGSSANNPNSRLQMAINTLMHRMMVCDLRRRQSYLSQRCRQSLPLADVETVHRQLTDCLLTYLHSNPCLQGNSTAADNCLRNLVLLYRNAEEYLAFCPSLFRRFVTCINSLMYHNGSQIRETMKSIGLFTIRDEIVLRCLAADLPPFQLSEFLASFSFDLVADQPRFRDSDGLLLLLRLLHRVPGDDRALLRQILGILAKSLLPIEGNRRAVQRIIDDNAVASRLLALHPQPSPINNPVKCNNNNNNNNNNSNNNNNNSNNNNNNSSGNPIDEFIEWYFGIASPDTLLRRQAIEQRLESACMPHSVACMAAQERALARRMKRLQQAKDKDLRSNSAINRVLCDYRTAIAQRLTSAAARHQQFQDQLRRERYDRRRLAEAEWNELIK
jgi:hypothetical protein